MTGLGERAYKKPLDQATALEAVIQEHGLVDEQADVLRLVAQKRNVFFTGAAGTGKSTVLKALVDFLRKMSATVAVIAPSGIAAVGLNVGASTLHTYAAWTVDSARRSLKALKADVHKTTVWKRFDETDVLIIDEISMVENDMLTRLSRVMRTARRSGGKNEDGEPWTTKRKDPFGGVQIVITGDFCQLPPLKPFETCLKCGKQQRNVRKFQTYECDHLIPRDEDKWAFRSPVWRRCRFKSVELKTIHRQADKQFIDILSRIRKGFPLADDQMRLLLSRRCDPAEVSKIGRVFLCPHRDKVDKINKERMSKLVSPIKCYQCLDDYWRPVDPEKPISEEAALQEKKDALSSLRFHRYSSELELRRGMQVLLLRNLDVEQGLVNGAQGRIVSFEAYAAERLPRAKSRKDGDESRDGRELIGHRHRHHAEDQIRTFGRETAGGPFHGWPIVQFENGRRRTIYPDCTTSEHGKDEPYSLLSRTQVPLIAGWAITIHKSQGMTLDFVTMDLGNCFEPGQAYVALSRARSLEKMLVTSLPGEHRLRPDPTVSDFMKETFGVEDATAHPL